MRVVVDTNVVVSALLFPPPQHSSGDGSSARVPACYTKKNFLLRGTTVPRFLTLHRERAGRRSRFGKAVDAWGALSARPYNREQMEVTVKVPEQLAAEARARGMSVQMYVQEILARQVRETNGERELQTVRAAIDRILELRKGNKLAGLRIKDLIHEGHKY